MTVESLDLSVLPDSSLDAKSPLWWGQILMATIEGTLFFILCVCYLYYRSKFNIWPPPGTHEPLFLASLSTAVLVLSCIPVYLADRAVQENDTRRVLIWELIVVVVGLLFLALRIAECRNLNFKWTSNEFGSIVWAMLWLHTFDYGAAIIEEIVLTVIFARNLVGPKQRLGIRVSTALYYLLVAIWLPLYVLIYLYPYWLSH